MARYIVTPILGARGVPYYVVTDTSTGKGVEGYGCDTWVQHRSVIWDCDFTFEEYVEPGKGIYLEYHCTHCGAEITYKISFDDDEQSETA